MVLVRFILISLIIYLIVRSFIRIGEEGTNSGQEKKTETSKKPAGKRISKAIGEYVDYEEVNKK